MRRLIIATCLTLGLTVSCATPEPVKSPRPLHPVYRGERPPVPTVHRHPQLTPYQRYAKPTRFDPAWYPKGRGISPRWTYIVLHHSATDSGGARTFDKHHRQQNGWDELGYHFVIGNGTETPDGYVEVGSRWHKQKHGAHCKTPNNYFNEHGIGICLVGDFTRTRPTRRQIESLKHLLRFLSNRCSIPPYRVTTHRAVKGTTQCPGHNFPLAALRNSMIAPGSVAYGR